MYKVASENAQRAASRGRFADWVAGGEENLTPEQLRENLVSRWKVVNDRLKKGTLTREERKSLGSEQWDLQQRISAIRPKARRPDAAQHFIDAARDILPREMFRLVMSRAVRLADAAKESQQ